VALGSEALEVPLGLSRDPSVDRLLSEIPKDAKSKLGAGFEKAFRGIESVGRDVFQRLGRYATSVFALAGAGGVGYELGYIANLNHATRLLGRTAELTAQQEQDLKDSLTDVATDIGVSRDEQLAGLQLLQDRYAVLNKVANEGTLGKQMEFAALLANGYNLELSDTYNLLGALNKMAGLTGDAMVDSLAMLEQAATMGSMGFKELGMVMPELLGAAGAIGQEGEGAVRDIAALLEGTTAVVQETGRARTYVRSFITRLGAADVGEKMMKKLGVATTDAEGNFRDLSDIVDDMLASLDKMSEAGRMEAVKDIFGSEEVMQVVAALQGKGRAAFEGIGKIQASREEFLDFLQRQADDSATELKKLKESTRALLDEAIEPLLGYITEHSDSLKAMVKWIASNPLKVGFAALFGPSLVKLVGRGIIGAISKGFAAKSVTDGISSGIKGAGSMTVYATNVNVVGGKGGVPGAAGKAGAAAGTAGQAAAGGMGLLGKLLNWKSIGLAQSLGLPAGAMLKMLGPAALTPGLGLAGMLGGSAAVAAGVLGFTGLGLSDYSKRQEKQRSKDIWTRADQLSAEGKEQFKQEYYALEENKRTAAILNRILDAIQAQETMVKTSVNITGTGGGETPPFDVEVH